VLISIIVTLKNEEKSIAKLLDSLLLQEKPFEIIIVDAFSTDKTREIIKKHYKKHPGIFLYKRRGSRGEGRNYGVSKAKGKFVAFIDGGCIANKNWLKNLRKKIKQGYNVVAGKTIDKGYFKDVKRVKIDYKGYDITYPSCNLVYNKKLFEKIKGFDIHFICAEDVDLNLRAVDAGEKITSTDESIVYRQSATGPIQLMKQAFWYGYGRKQITLKHGRLWMDYSAQHTLATHLNLKSLVRLIFGVIGYIVCKIFRDKIR
jgi:glycosyltransferase involved in cell wall biosynthesis